MMNRGSCSSQVGILVFFVCILSVLLTPCQMELSGNEKDKVSQLSQRLEQLFLGNKTELYQIRDVFFPSSRYRYWQADETEVIDADVCLTIETVSSAFSCSSLNKQGKDKLEDSFKQCWVFRWTNSYFLNLIDIHQLYCFDPATTATLFGTIARTYGERMLRISLNIPCDDLLSSMNKQMLQQSLIQFLSWSKAYARSQGRLDKLDGVDQGYVTRKYDYASVNLLLFDEQSQLIYQLTSICFILCNILTLYLMLRNSPTIYKKLSNAANQTNGYGRSIIKGSVVLLAVILAPSYFLGITIVHKKSQPFTKPCDDDDYYFCIPQDEILSIHHQQVESLASKASIVLAILPLYLFAAIYTIKTAAGRGIMFRGCIRYLEVYFLWGVLVSIHIGIGITSLPLIIFTILIPTYVVFYLSACIIGLILILLPIAGIFYMCDQAKTQTDKKYILFRVCNFLLVYLLTSGISVILLSLYYFFLAGGASMNGMKGVLFSLLPPVLISTAALAMKRKLFVKSLGEQRSLLKEQTRKSHYINV